MLSDPVIISQADVTRPVIDTLPFEKRDVRRLVVASDNAHVAICYDDGLLWMGNLEDEKVRFSISKFFEKFRGLCSTDLYVQSKRPYMFVESV